MSLNRPRPDEGVNRNAVRHRVPESDVGGLVFGLLPIARKDKDRHDQRSDKTRKDDIPRAEIPRVAGAGYLHSDGVDPAQQHAEQHAKEHLHFRAVVILLGRKLERDRVVEDERVHEILLL